MNFLDMLATAERDNSSMLCVGLDPDVTRLPAPFAGDATRIFDFCAAIVDATADVALAYKPQIAYFAANRAEAQLEQLEVSLDETEIKAPFDGVITKKYIEEGSMISTGTPLVAVQDPDDNWVDIKVPETQLAAFKVDQDVELIARDGKTKVTGTITDISKKAEYATQRATSEPDRAAPGATPPPRRRPAHRMLQT